MTQENTSHKKISKIIKNNENVLKYTLFFDTETIPELNIPENVEEISVKEATEYVEKCFDYTLEVCKYKIKPQYYFHKEEQNYGGKSAISDFASLDNRFSYWNFIFKQHAILSTYDKVRKLIAFINKSNITNFNIWNLQNGPCCKDPHHNGNYGMHYLLTTLHENQFMQMEKLATLDNDCKLHCKKAYEDRESKIGIAIRSNHRNTTRKATTLHGNIQNTNTLFFKGLNASSDTHTDLIYLNCLEFFNCTAGRRITETVETEAGKTRKSFNVIPTQKLKSIYNKEVIFNETAYHNYIESRNLILSGLENNDNPVLPNNNHFTLADKVYCKYAIESCFGFDIIDSLYQNIHNSDEQEFLIQLIDAVSLIYKLPNVFSRQHILQMSIDNLKYNYYNDENKESNLVVRLTPYSESTKLSFKNLFWLDKYVREMNSLLNFTLPTIEGHFFNTLWKSTASISTDIGNRLKSMFFILSSYLNDETNVKQLLIFDEDFDSINPKPNFANLINPFEKNNVTNYKLYDDCIQSFNKLHSIDQNRPFLMNYEHISSLQSDMGKIIRKHIIEAASNIS